MNEEIGHCELRGAHSQKTNGLIACLPLKQAL